MSTSRKNLNNVLMGALADFETDNEKELKDLLRKTEDKYDKKCAEKDSRIKELLEIINQGAAKKHAQMESEMTKL